MSNRPAMSRRSDHQPATVEVIGVDADERAGDLPDVQPPRPRPGLLSVIAILVVGAIFLTLTTADDDSTQQQDEADANRAELHSLDRLDALITAGSLPPELVAAEVYRASPGPETLRFLLRSLSGVEGVTVATAEGSFDLISFNPRDLNQLAASRRTAYGPAQNQDVNEAWLVTPSGAVLTSPLAPGVEHDIAHYNDYGTLTFWSRVEREPVPDRAVDATDATAPNPPTGRDFAPRVVTLSPIPSLDDRSTEPVYASRSVIATGALFALTGDPDHESDAGEFESLIADGGEGRIVLDDGAAWAWVDNPLPGVVLSYPVDDGGSTAAWSAETFDRLDEHPLAGRPYRRLAVSGNETTMVGVTFDGTLEVVDLGTDRVTRRFGRLDPGGIADPITLNHDGTIAVTVDRDGSVTLWWVGDPEPIAIIDGDAEPPRLVSEYRAPRVSSAVAPGADRVAVRNRAEPGVVTTWSIIDTNPARWVDEACKRAGRSLTAGERLELGLDLLPPVCT